MNDVAIDVKGISKKYTISVGYDPDNLREKIMDIFHYPIKVMKGTHKTKKQIFWAVKDVSFQVEKGEVLGIIGRNGAGKSTILKILSRVTEPTCGSITMQGKVASLLEVGTGFNPELTGRENIFLNGAIIGMSRKVINQKFHDIVDFAGIGNFLDTPVKRYSSGMYVRLAFAVAAHLDSDILLVDEVLAVGDAEFQKKCIGKMNNLARTGKTVVFISHSLPSISKLCTKCIWIVNGKIKATGDTRTVIDAYIDETKSHMKDIDNTVKPATQQKGPIRVENIFWVNDRGEPVKYYRFGDKIILRYVVRFNESLKNVGFGFALLNDSDERILTSHQVDDESSDIPKIFQGKMVFDMHLDLETIAPGQYRTIVGAKDQLSNRVLFYSEEYAPLIIREPYGSVDGASGFLWHTGKWRLVKERSKK